MSTDLEYTENEKAPTVADDTVYPIGELSRITLVCLEPDSAETTYQWALNNFIRSHIDLVILLHVRQVDVPVSPYVNSTGYMEEVKEEKREASHQLLKSYAEKLSRRQVNCRAISMLGDPKSEILRKSLELKADVILMGARKMGTIKRTILGSVSDYVVHNSDCTVIVTKPCLPSAVNESRQSIATFMSEHE
ncbi:hypothetical protein BDB01DRAFT_833467 [Pilobolus umbonatus]|nr:hypothetical protein BDB01DRAFT_833467 [Pilobolus umbonatus]